MSILKEEDLRTISEAVDKIAEARKLDVKASKEVDLSLGLAKVYHMGKLNPVIRVDIRMEE